MRDLKSFIQFAKREGLFWKGRRLEFVFKDALTSTNSFAEELSKTSTKEYFLLTDKQYKGRGQKQNKWESPEGVGLYFTFLLHPDLPVKDVLTLPITWGEMIKEVIVNATNLEPEIKSPNDVLINKKKVAGVLIETQILGEFCKTLIAGVGINVNTKIENFSNDIKDIATSLFMESGNKYSRSEILLTFFKTIEKY